MGLVGKVPRRRMFQHFYRMGANLSERITGFCRKHNIEIAELDSVLDFGCGCGRVIRHWPSGPTLYGCDYNPALVEWCQTNLPFAQFALNNLTPPLPYE